MQRTKRHKRKSKNRSGAIFLVIVLLGFFLMIFYVSLKVETNSLSAEIQQLRVAQNRLLVENEELRAEVATLSSFGRIQKIAQEKLGLVFLPNEDVVEIEED
jgi:cell division protein FtsL